MAGSLVAVFDGTLDGFLNVIYAHYYEKRNFTEIVHERDFIPGLFDYVHISTNGERAVRVMRAIRKISVRTDEMVYKAFLSHQESRFNYLYNYIIKAFKAGSKINNNLTDPDVHAVYTLCRNVGKEAERFIQFSRFSQMGNGVFYCKIAPKSNVLPLVAEHFINRFRSQPWLIHDETYKQAAVYDMNEYIIVDVSGREFKGYEADNAKYKDLWKVFFDAVAVEGRINYKLQRNHVPLWYRKNMLEFNSQEGDETHKIGGGQYEQQ